MYTSALLPAVCVNCVAEWLLYVVTIVVTRQCEWVLVVSDVYFSTALSCLCELCSGVHVVRCYYHSHKAVWVSVSCVWWILQHCSQLRLRCLQSLLSFMQRAVDEIAWLNEKEEIEVSRDWSSPNLQLQELEDYFEVTNCFLLFTYE